MADKIIGLSENDVKVLKELIATVRSQPVNTPGRTLEKQPPDTISSSYLALATGGIPARSGTTPGNATCRIYQKVGSVVVDAGFDRVVYNAGDAVASGAYALVKQDNWGVYWTKESSGSSPLIAPCVNAIPVGAGIYNPVFASAVTFPGGNWLVLQCNPTAGQVTIQLPLPPTNANHPSIYRITVVIDDDTGFTGEFGDNFLQNWPYSEVENGVVVRPPLSGGFAAEYFGYYWNFLYINPRMGLSNVTFIWDGGGNWTVENIVVDGVIYVEEPAPGDEVDGVVIEQLSKPIYYGTFFDPMSHSPPYIWEAGGPVPEVINGSSSGTAEFSQPFWSKGYKRVVIYCASLSGVASYTFPVSFDNVPQILSGMPSVVTTLTTTGVTLTGSSSTGFIELSGR